MFNFLKALQLNEGILWFDGRRMKKIWKKRRTD